MRVNSDPNAMSQLHSARTRRLLLAVVIITITAAAVYIGSHISDYDRLARPAQQMAQPHESFVEVALASMEAYKKGLLDPDKQWAAEGTDPQPLTDHDWVFTAAPDLAYRRYEKRAKAGVAEAQLYLSMIVERCSHSEVRSRERLEYLSARGDIPVEMLREFERIFQQCAGLYTYLQEYDLDELSVFWLESAARELSVAKLRLLTSKHQLSVEHYALVTAALESSQGNPVFEASSLNAAYSYYRLRAGPGESVDPATIDPGYYRGEPDDLAWDYLECLTSLFCEISRFQAILERHFYEHEIRHMESRAIDILAAFQRGQWHKMGLQLENGTGRR